MRVGHHPGHPYISGLAHTFWLEVASRRISQWFRKTNWDDYFPVSFDHFYTFNLKIYFEAAGAVSVGCHSMILDTFFLTPHPCVLSIFNITVLRLLCFELWTNYKARTNILKPSYQTRHYTSYRISRSIRKNKKFHETIY